MLNKKLIFTLVIGACCVLALGIVRANEAGRTREGVLSIENPAQSGSFMISASSDSHSVISPVQKSDFMFNSIVARWETSRDISFTLSLRFLNESWSPWSVVTEDDDYRDDRPVTKESAPLPTKRTDTFQYKITFSSEDDKSALTSLTFHYIDTSSGPHGVFGIAATDSQNGLAIVPRATWGASDAYLQNASGAPAWESEYYSPKRFIVHHTGGVDANKNAAATVRAIYYWHAVGRGWGDIGYNYLIDNKGTIYEGRTGGEGIVGGHTYLHNRNSIGIALLGCYQVDPSDKETSNCTKVDPITPEMKESLAKLIAVKAQEFNININGSETFEGKKVPTVAGHRDWGKTNCPGSGVYGALSDIRARAYEKLSALPPLPPQKFSAELVQVSDDSISIPANKTGQITVQYKNTGTAVWRGYEDTYVFVADASVKQKLSSIESFRMAAATQLGPVAAFKLIGGNVYPGQIGSFSVAVEPTQPQGKKDFTLAWSDRGYFPAADFSVSYTRTAPVADDGTAVAPVTAACTSEVSVPFFKPKTAGTVTITCTNTSPYALDVHKLSLGITSNGAVSLFNKTASLAPAETTALAGAVFTFTLPLTAPGGGIYPHHAVLTYDGAEIAATDYTLTVKDKYVALVVSHTIPTSVDSSFRKKVELVIKNIGTEPWRGVNLSSGTPKYKYSRFIDNSWINQQIVTRAKDTIKPDQEVKFTFYLDASGLNGTYSHFFTAKTRDAKPITLDGNDQLKFQTVVTKAKKSPK